MKLKKIIFSKGVDFQGITKEIELIHQLGFFVEVESVDDWKGMLNRSYELRAVMWEEVEEVAE